MPFGWIHAAILVALFVVSMSLTHYMIRKAERLGLIDIPNYRSSHVRPTPRGGGVAFVITFSLGVAIFYFLDLLGTEWVWPLAAGGSLVAIVGFVDDRYSLPASLRLAVQIVAAAVTYFILTPKFSTPDYFDILGVDTLLKSNVTAFFFCLIFIAWLINLYNFMDGVDGLASTQAVVVALVLGVFGYWQGSHEVFILYILMAITVSGFLVYNWPPAKIFMGDCGAYFLGFAFAGLALMSKVYLNQSLVVPLIMLGMFIVDATYTLIRRALRRERILQAHRGHVYQRIVARGLSHRRVTTLYNLVTIFWLSPLAAASVVYPKLRLLVLFAAYAPLVVLAYAIEKTQST